MTVTGQARVAGVIGWPIGHSRSPQLHGYWLDRYGIDGAYVPLPVAPERLEQAIRALPALGLAGVNVTVPHKEAVLPLMDEVEPLARRIGAVNTVVVGDDAGLWGRNTDAFGFMAALRAGAPTFDPATGPAVVLGAGGAARAVVAALIEAGAPVVRLVNRTVAKAERIAADLGGPVEPIDWERRGDALGDAALLVNATSLGMKGRPALEFDLDALPLEAVVNDIVYTPLETDLLAAARARGNPAVDGLGMLLHQARPAFEAFFGRDPEVTTALRDHVLAGD